MIGMTYDIFFIIHERTVSVRDGLHRSGQYGRGPCNSEWPTAHQSRPTVLTHNHADILRYRAGLAQYIQMNFMLQLECVHCVFPNVHLSLASLAHPVRDAAHSSADER